jgi:hypothetical protein
MNIYIYIYIYIYTHTYNSVENVLPVFKIIFFIPALKSLFFSSVTGLRHKAAILHLRMSIYFVGCHV